MKLSALLLLASNEVYAGSAADMAAWKPIIETQVMGQYRDAWIMMKHMPQFKEKLANDTDGFFTKFHDMNEAGQYQAAFDMMLQWKIEKFGADMVCQMGYQIPEHKVHNPYHKPKPATFETNGQKWREFYESMSPTASGEEVQEFWRKQAEMKAELGTNDSYHQESKEEKNWEAWLPIQKLQQQGNYQGAWELMKNMPEIKDKASDPDMAKFIAMNEAGEYKAAFDGMMIWKIEKYGAETVESWGYDISEYTTKKDWSKWIPIQKLQQAGDYQGAYEAMKNMSDWEELAQMPHMTDFIAMNEAGKFEEAYDMMMKFKIEKWGAETIKAWGYDVSKYVNETESTFPGKWGPPHGKWGHPKREHWMEKKRMFEESGMKDLVEPIMNPEVMEQIVAAVDNMGGMDKLLGKLEKYSDPEFARLQQNIKAKKQEAYTIATIHGAVSVLDLMIKDKRDRATVDRLSKLAKELPEATTCTSYTGMLSCGMEASLASTPYTDSALWPADMLDIYTNLGMATPRGSGDQSVLTMPNVSAFMSGENKSISALATSVGSGLLALTTGTSCVGPFLDDFDFNTVDVDYSDPLDFHVRNKPKALTPEESEMFTVVSHAGEHKPWGKIIAPTCKAAGRTIQEIKRLMLEQNELQEEELEKLKLKLGDQTVCALFFKDPLPLWPACSPLDNGQMYYAMHKEKQKIKEQTNHVWGERVEMELETLNALGKINEQLITTRYRSELAKMKIPCLHSKPKQCFISIVDSTTNKVVSKPVEILDYASCVEKFSEPVCKLNYYIKDDQLDTSVGAPLLCAEEGSVSMRALQGPKHDGYHQLMMGDYNIVALGADFLNHDMFTHMEKMIYENM